MSSGCQDLSWETGLTQATSHIDGTHNQQARHLITGGRLSLFHLTLDLIQSIASLTPVPVRADTGSTRESRMPPDFSPSKTRLTNPSLIRTTSTQSSRSCLLARINSGTPSASEFCSTSSSTARHSSRRPLFSCSRSPSPISVLSMINTIAWQLA